jgi:hypothetical protein
VVQGDSQLVVNQVNKAYDCPQMWEYVDEVRKIEIHFDVLKLEHIPHRKNVIADEFSQIATKRLPVPAGIFVERLTKPSTTPRLVVRTPGTPSPGAVPATTAHQGSAALTKGKDLEPVPIVALAERATPLGRRS